MNAKETLEKYGLATDVKSIRERIEKNDYFHFVLNSDFPMDFRSDEIHNEAQRLRSADLSLLCELAEKGERYERVVERSNQAKLGLAISVVSQYCEYTVNDIREIIDGIIDEPEGEPK